MRTLSITTAIFLLSGQVHALEAVAQSTSGAGSASAAQNIALETRLTQTSAQTQAISQVVQELNENILACAQHNPPQLWNGITCVDIGVPTAPPSATTVTIPSCAETQTLTATNGVLTCITPPVRRWQNLTSARRLATVYHNELSHPIEVTASVYSGATGNRCSLYLLINGTLIGYQFMNNNTGASQCSATATVPPGAEYRADSVPDNTLSNWAELR